MNLGENIYRFRSQKNMSQGDLADALEVSRQSVSKWENNSAVPELDKLLKMAEIFDISLDVLVTGEEKPSDPSAPAPTPITIVTPPPKSTAKQLGVMLIGLGILAFIILFVAEFTAGSAWCIIVGLPLVFIGICCLLPALTVLFVCDFILIGLFIAAWISGARDRGMIITGIALALVNLVPLGIKVYKYIRARKASPRGEAVERQRD